jgi:hypothetical protein
MRMLNRSRLALPFTGGQHFGQGDGGARVVRRTLPGGCFLRIPIHVIVVIFTPTMSACHSLAQFDCRRSHSLLKRSVWLQAELGKYTPAVQRVQQNVESTRALLAQLTDEQKTFCAAFQVPRTRVSLLAQRSTLLGWVQLSLGAEWLSSDAPCSAPVSAFVSWGCRR